MLLPLFLFVILMVVFGVYNEPVVNFFRAVASGMI